MSKKVARRVLRKVSIVNGSDNAEQLRLFEVHWTAHYESLRTWIDVANAGSEIDSTPKVQLRRPKIYRMPGGGLEKIARIFFTRKTFEQVFKPELADMQKEYLDALERGDQLGARICVVRGWIYFATALAAYIPVSMVKKLWSALG